MTHERGHTIFINAGSAKDLATEIAEIICKGHQDFFARAEHLEFPPIEKRSLWQKLTKQEDDVSLRKAFHILKEKSYGNDDLKVIRGKLRTTAANALNDIIDEILSENGDTLITKKDVMYDDRFEFGVRIRNIRFTPEQRNDIQKRLADASEKALTPQDSYSFGNVPATVTTAELG